MRRVILLLLLFLSAIPLRSQSLSQTDAIRTFVGSASVEELDSYDVEQLQDLLARPVELNLCNRSRLIDCGLFSAYQAASLISYRKEHGAVLSFSELAALDGFGKEFTDRIAPFVSLKSSRLPGKAYLDNEQWKHDMAIKGAFKLSAGETAGWSGGIKYRVDCSERFSAALAFSRSYDNDNLTSAHLLWKSRRLDAKILLGDFNARFGQGLALWNGMSMSGVSSASSLVRRASGISQSWSFTGSSAFSGFAASMVQGDFSVSAMLAGEGLAGLRHSPDKSSLLPALNLSWLKGCMQFSLTSYAEFSAFMTEDPRIPDLKSSFDLSCCIKGTDIFGEAVWDWVNSCPAALAGSSFSLGESFRLAFNLRYYPAEYASGRSAAVRSASRCSNEYGVSAAADFRGGRYMKISGAEGFGAERQRFNASLSIDASYYPSHQSRHSSQIRLVNSWDILLADSFQLLLKLSERVRCGLERPMRSELRADLKYLSRYVFSTLRMNFVAEQSIGLLSYLEGGYKGESLSLYFRQGIFFIDEWADRIYVYERDAPGSFNVPAFYGRGLWSALTASWRFARWGRLYLRGALTSYPFMPPENKKPGKAELKLQTVLTF